MCTALIIGDPHFRRDNARETLMLTERCITVVKERKPNFIVVLGDTLHNHERCDLMSLNRAYDFLSALSALSPTYVLIGNHDILNNSCYQTQYHAFNPLKRWPNVTIVDRAITTTICGFQFSFVPYVEPGRFVEALNTIDLPLDQNGVSATILATNSSVYSYLFNFFESSICKLIGQYADCPATDSKNNWINSIAIFCHQEFAGAKTGIIRSTKGDPWPSDYPNVISGHIHEYDRLASNILYVGTPAQYNFGEATNKTISLLTFSHGKKEYQEQRINLGIPQKITYKLTATEVLTFTIPETQDTVRCMIEGKRVELTPIRSSKKIKDWERRGVKIKYIELPEDEIKSSVPIPKNKSYRDLLYDACKAEGMEQLYSELFGVTKLKHFNLVISKQ